MPALDLISRRRLAFAALAAFVGLAAPARAQQNECVLDRCLQRSEASRSDPMPDRRMRSAVAPGDFDYYVLALSWSPGFCAVSAGPRDADQCERGMRLGFVVHGLWPQRDFGGPENCAAGQRPPLRSDVAAVRDLFPTESLARYQWRKHGGCTGLPPSAYFADVRRAREAVVIPQEFARMREPDRIDPQDILRAFREANPRLRPGMAAVSCPKNVFQEVRICMSKNLRDFAPCPEVVTRSCRARSVAVPPPL